MKFRNDRIIHLIFYGIYLPLCLLGVLSSFFGWIHNIHNEFYIFFTNQSNIISIVCVACLLFSAIKDIKQDNKSKREDRFVNFAFCVFIYQTITMILYNALTPDGHIFTAKFWSQLPCPILHLFAPLLFGFIFIAFLDKQKISKFSFLYVCIYPLIYALFILIRSFILGDVEPFEISGFIRFPYIIFDYQRFNGWIITLFMFIGLILFMGITIGLTLLFKKEKSGN